MRPSVAVFRFAHQAYFADTCEPLKRAAARGDVQLRARGRGAYPGASLPEKALPEVRSFGCWDAAHNQEWGLDWHRNEGIELTYLSRGKVHFGVDNGVNNQEFLLKRGDLTVTRPWQLHRVGNPGVTACHLHWLILDVGVRRPNQAWNWPKWLVSSASDIQSLTAMLSHNEQPVWQANDEVEYYFEQLVVAIEPFNESRAKLYITGLLVAITELLHHHRPTLDKSLSSAQRTVELFLASLPERVDAPWDLAMMAAACGLGRSRFTHYCKEITNMSPIEYLTCCRVEAATHLLRTQCQLSITDVVLRCGFDSSQYFTKVFHSRAGCSPRDYRRQEVTTPHG